VEEDLTPIEPISPIPQKSVSGQDSSLVNRFTDDRLL